MGPFGAKNFCTTISPWVVTLEALEPFRCATSAGEQKDPEPLPYLRTATHPHPQVLDIKLQVGIQSEKMEKPHVFLHSNAKV